MPCHQRSPGRWLALGLAAFCIAVPPLTAEVPSWIPGDDGLPMWVSADVAAPDGEMRWELIAPVYVELHQWALENVKREGAAEREKLSPGENCLRYTDLGRRYYTPGPGKRSPAEYRAAAYAIYSGTFVEKKYGFYNGMPGTLYEFVPESALKEAGDLQTPRSLYVHFPYAEIKIDNEYLCTKGYRSKERPEVGAEAVLVLEERPGEHFVVAPQDHELFYRNPDGEAAFPHDYQHTDQSLGDVASAFSGEAEQ